MNGDSLMQNDRALSVHPVSFHFDLYRIEHFVYFNERMKLKNI